MSDTAKPPAMRVTNPVLQAMAKVDEILAPMDEKDRAKVLTFMVQTYAGGQWLLTVGKDTPKPTEE